MDSQAARDRVVDQRRHPIDPLLWLGVALVSLGMVSFWSLSLSGMPVEALVLVPGWLILLAGLIAPQAWKPYALCIGLQTASLGVAFNSGFLLPNPWVVTFSICAVSALSLAPRQAWLIWACGLGLWIGCGVWFMTGAPLPSGAAFDLHRPENWLRITIVYGGFSAGLMGIVAQRVTRMEHAIAHNEQMRLQLVRETDRRAEIFQQERRLEGELHQSQKLAAIGALADGIAQDFNNLLAVMLDRAERIGQASHLPALKHNAEAIIAAAESGKGLTRQLLALNKRHAQLDVVIDVARSVRATVPILKRLLPTSIALDVQCDDDLLPITGPAIAIEQMLLNLCVNARDALPNGGTIRIEAGTRGDHLRLAVTDDGVGMDAATCARVFDRFFTTKEPGKGTGLGLSTVRALAHSCGGHVKLESVPAVGSTFEVWLPTSPRHGEAALKASRTRSKVLLVAGDEPQLRDILMSTLERAGYSTLRAVDGADALCVLRARSQEIALIVIDATSGLSLDALYESSRALSPELPFLICGGQRDRVASGSLASGQNAFLAQPFGRHELLATVEALLERAARSKSARATQES